MSYNSRLYPASAFPSSPNRRVQLATVISELWQDAFYLGSKDLLAGDNIGVRVNGNNIDLIPIADIVAGKRESAKEIVFRAFVKASSSPKEHALAMEGSVDFDKLQDFVGDPAHLTHDEDPYYTDLRFTVGRLTLAKLPRPLRRFGSHFRHYRKNLQDIFNLVSRGVYDDKLPKGYTPCRGDNIELVHLPFFPPVKPDLPIDHAFDKENGPVPERDPVDLYKQDGSLFVEGADPAFIEALDRTDVECPYHTLPVFDIDGKPVMPSHLSSVVPGTVGAVGFVLRLQVTDTNELQMAAHVVDYQVLAEKDMDDIQSTDV